MSTRVAILLAVALAGAGASRQAPASAPTYTRIHALKPREGVFAYARVSPDGNKLVYASQLPIHPGQLGDWTETVVDLSDNAVLFNESGVDAYWSPDGTKIIYSADGVVTVRDIANGTKVLSPAAGKLGDYYSWAERHGKDLILTIQSNYYYLDHDKAVLPPAKVSTCPGIGTGDRPLIAHDGTRITTFVDGNIVVRSLDNCDAVFNTGVQGAKADFSWDGRFIAFHAIRPSGEGYEIKIVDLKQKTIRTLSGLAGSALFPSWTKDGRLCFRYDGADYRGFMMASRVLAAPASPLPSAPGMLPPHRTWPEIFRTAPEPAGSIAVVIIWAPWSAHSRAAFRELTAARDYLAQRIPGLTVAAAADPGSAETDIAAQLTDFHVRLPRVPLTTQGLLLTEGRNQMPTILLFKDGILISSKLGAQSFDMLRDWIAAAAGLK